MNKLFLLLLLALCSCSVEFDEESANRERLRKEAEEFCSCHSGLDTLAYNAASYSITCKDGKAAYGKGDMTAQHFVSGSCK